jgi:hypothetical protein
MGDRHDPKLLQLIGRCARLMQELTIARQRNPVPRGLVVRLMRELSQAEIELSGLSASIRPELSNLQSSLGKGIKKSHISK